eukprot:scaffold13021_cov127-Isochrysis_galbana.AAC.3
MHRSPGFAGKDLVALIRSDGKARCVLVKRVRQERWWEPVAGGASHVAGRRVLLYSAEVKTEPLNNPADLFDKAQRFLTIEAKRDVSPPLFGGLRVGGRGSYSKFVFQHCSSSLGPLFVLFGPGAGSVLQRPSGKKASQSGCPPKKGKECVQERS